MAVFTDPIDFVSLYGADGVGWLCGVRDSTTDATGRKNAVNWAYLDLAGIKGYWRLTSFDLTSASSPALTAGTATYNCQTNYNDPFRFYYRQNGRAMDIEIVPDSLWLDVSANRSTDAGYPRYVRMKHDGTNYEFEFDKPPSATFVSSIGTITQEYFRALTLLSSDTDQPILPKNLRPLILPLAAWRYALTQGDSALADRLKPDADAARGTILRYDLTRTGRPRRMRPGGSYAPRGAGQNDYGES